MYVSEQQHTAPERARLARAARKTAAHGLPYTKSASHMEFLNLGAFWALPKISIFQDNVPFLGRHYDKD